jgi:Flp pilus assembly protein TadD
MWGEPGQVYRRQTQALVRLGRDLEAAGALALAESTFATAVAERPRDAGAWNGLGSVEAVRGNLRKALNYVDKALAIQPDSPEAQQDRAGILAALGQN